MHIFQRRHYGPEMSFTMFRIQNPFFTVLLASLFFTQSIFGQNETLLEPQPAGYQAATPAHMWEFGLHGGTAMSWGDVDYVPNWGAGFHFRRAMDYVFSLRGEALIAQLVSEDNNDGSAETNWQSGSLQLLVSFNNLVWSANRNRKVNVYGLVGGGINRFKVDVTTRINTDLQPFDYVTQSHADVGAGLAFRLSNRFNLGFETKASMIFGTHSDRLDGVRRQDSDILSYSSVRLNFNLGNTEKRAEPLYWVNPMDMILQDVTELKNRPSFDMTDTDGDGVIDLVDQDNSTPEGVDVDTRGLPLDSDGDGVPNYQDDEPFLTESSKIVTSDPDGKPLTTEDDVNRIVDEKLREMNATGGGGAIGSGGAVGGANAGAVTMINSFLPTVHFNIDSYTIRYADYGHLASIAKLMQSNPELQIVVTGFTDKTASDSYNDDLSYRRASSAINHLVNVYGISRSRLILNYNGEDEPLVPSTGSNMMNRRVEFRVATSSDFDMKRP